MFTGFINQSHFLQAVGWGILHSFWQTALLWILYKAVAADNQHVSASFRYNLGLFCLSGSLLWFVLTAVNQYLALENGHLLPLDIVVFNREVILSFSQGILPVLSFIYLSLLLFNAIQFVRQYGSLYKLRKVNLIKPSVEIRLFTQQSAYRLGITKDVRCWLSEKVDAPFVTGFFKPVIMLPFSLLNHLTTTQAEAVILHELAHIKRNDYLVNLFQLIAEKLLFFNPFARLLSNAVRVEREHCCDDYVLQFRFSQHEYAHALLQVEQLRSQQLLLAMNATSGKKKLLERIKRIFATEPAIAISGGQKIKLATVAAGMLVALILLVPVSKNELLTLSPVSVAGIYTASDDVANVNTQQSVTVKIKPPITPQSKKRVTTEVPLIKERSVQTEATPAELLSEEPASTMMINEDLLNTSVEPVATAISLDDQPAANKNVLMVRVEEEVGGSTEKKVYYVQVNNTNGQTEVKPLAIVKQAVSDTTGLKETAKTNSVLRKKLSLKKSKTI